MERILADTSFIYALLDRSDNNFTQAVASLRTLAEKRWEPFLTNFVVAEVYALILSRLGMDVAFSWLEKSIWPVERVGAEDEVAAREILKRYKDKSVSYVDACSFAVLNRLGCRRVLSFDAHFRQYGFADGLDG